MDQARLEKIMVSPGATIREAIEAIDAGAVEIALVVDEDRRLLGTITDGDVRRAMLRGTTLEDAVSGVTHTDPVSAGADASREHLLRLMTDRGVEQIPLLDSDGRVVQLAFLREIVADDPDADSPVVVMAGGEGHRLRPLTEDTPKPMLDVGGRPLLETVLGQVRDAGFSRVMIAVRYKAEAIEEHFGDGRGPRTRRLLHQGGGAARFRGRDHARPGAARPSLPLDQRRPPHQGQPRRAPSLPPGGGKCAHGRRPPVQAPDSLWGRRARGDRGPPARGEADDGGVRQRRHLRGQPRRGRARPRRP